MTDNNIIYYFCAYLTFFLAYLFVLIDSVHFFQLNSYRHDTHRKWLRENKRKFISPVIFALLAFAVYFIPVDFWHQMATVCVFGLMAIVKIPARGKKPLVYTARVKRMFLTAMIITFVPIILVNVFVKDSVIMTAVFCSYIALSSVMMLIADFFNKPMEKSINNSYIRDAKRILKSCPDLKIIGVTGSFGKTSVKYYLNTLLQAKYNVLMTPESYNTPMGVVKTIRGSLKSTHEIFICEMGAKWVGDIKELCDIVHPQHGVITSIGPQHLETFGSLDNVKSTKFELADSLPEGGLLFLNMDDKNIRSVEKKRPYISYTVNGDGDYNATDISVSSRGTTFKVTAKNGESETYTTKLLGVQSVVNITGAIAIANQFGIPLRALKGQVRKLEVVPHRLALTDNGSAIIIDDAYNSNPSGSKAALDVLSLFEEFKIAVTPGMVELGEKQFELNKEFGKQMADVCDFVILVGRKQAVPMKEGLLEKGFDERKIYVASTVNEAVTHAYALNSKGRKKVILLENDLPDNY